MSAFPTTGRRDSYIANDISANPWKLDTAATVYTGPVKVKNIVWNPTAVSQALIIKDINGKDVVNISIQASGSNLNAFSTGDIGWVRGLVVNTISAGTEVTVYIGAGK